MAALVVSMLRVRSGWDCGELMIWLDGEQRLSDLYILPTHKSNLINLFFFLLELIHFFTVTRGNV